MTPITAGSDVRHGLAKLLRTQKDRTVDDRQEQIASQGLLCRDDVYYAAGEANYGVDILEVVDQKIKAVSKHVSQFEPSINKYRADWDPQDLRKLIEYLKGRATKKDGKYVEAFRRATGFNAQ